MNHKQTIENILQVKKSMLKKVGYLHMTTAVLYLYTNDDFFVIFNLQYM